MASKPKTLLRKINIIFFCFFCLFYPMILLSDWSLFISAFWGNVIKYIFIWICMIYAWITSADICLPIALSLTVVADLFLLFGTSDSIYSVGIFVFCIAQLFHAFQLDPQKKFRSAFVFWIASLAGLIVFVLATFALVPEAIMIGVSIAYAILLIQNFILAFIRLLGKRNKTMQPLVLAFIGFTLFLLCDISVMLYNVIGTSDIPAVNRFVSIAGNCMWTFYAPSQYFLAQSYLNPRKQLANRLKI